LTNRLSGQPSRAWIDLKFVMAGFAPSTATVSSLPSRLLSPLRLPCYFTAPPPTTCQAFFNKEFFRMRRRFAHFSTDHQWVVQFLSDKPDWTIFAIDARAPGIRHRLPEGQSARLVSNALTFGSNSASSPCSPLRRTISEFFQTPTSMLPFSRKPTPPNIFFLRCSSYGPGDTDATGQGFVNAIW